MNRKDLDNLGYAFCIVMIVVVKMALAIRFVGPLLKIAR